MKYSSDQLNFLEQSYKDLRLPELTEAFNKKYGLNKSKSAISGTLKNHGFKCGRLGGCSKGESILFTDEQIEFLKNNCIGISKVKLTTLLNEYFDTAFSVDQVRNFSKRRGFLSGLTGYFDSGHKPWNKDTKGLVKPNSGNFTKGHIPKNIKPIGHERICSKDGYILIKIKETNPYTGAATRYKAKHIVNWEMENGPVPEGMNVTFIDGDKLNCDISNLELLTKGESLRRNQLNFSKVPDELKPIVTAIAKLDAKRFTLEKGESDDI